MRVPDEIRKSVLFIGVKDELPEWEWKGTGYLLKVLVPDNVVEGRPIIFLATARHVAEKLESRDFALRLNSNNGQLAIIEGGADQKWWYHPTEKRYVDAAVTIFYPPNLNDLDIFPIDLAMCVSRQNIHAYDLGVGDEVFLAGLFTHVTETTRNVPIVRIGNLAMMPGERIPYKDGRLIDTYLVESRSIGGLSGSPVFIRQTVFMKGFKPETRFNSSQHVPPSDLSAVMAGTGRIFFLGSMIGHWDSPTGFALSEHEAVNMGISPVVPAHKIKEIIEQPQLQEVLKEMAEELNKRKHAGAKEDFATERGKEQEKVFTKEDFEAALRKASHRLSDRK